MDVLDDVVMLELSTGIAGPCAGKLFADAGARVIKVEPPGGDELRRRAPAGVELGRFDLGRAGSALFQHLNAGKEWVVGVPGDAGVDGLLARATARTACCTRGRATAARTPPPQGLYECGPQRWVAISVEHYRQWDGLKRVLGNPAWAEAAELSTAAGRHQVPTIPFRYASVDRWVRTPAPRLGADNEQILRDYLHLTDAEIERLRADAIIGTEPLGSNPSFDL